MPFTPDWHPADEEPDEDDPFDWDEHRWEEALQDTDEHREMFGRLLDKYGTDADGLKKILEEMGWTHFADAFEEDLEPEEERSEVDQIVKISQEMSQDDAAYDGIISQLGQQTYELTTHVLKLEAGNLARSADHPLVILINCVLDCCGNLAGAGYMRTWSEEEDQNLTPKGLKLALLKRSRQQLGQAVTLLGTPDCLQSLTPSEIKYVELRVCKLIALLEDEITLLRSLPSD